MSKGYFTIAQGDNYIRMAYALALSLKATQSGPKDLSIGVTPGTEIPEDMLWAFDRVVDIPWGDDASEESWKLSNEWKAFWMSPYDETIKLDADMLFFTDNSAWWEVFQRSDMVFATEVKTYREEAVTSDYYRKVFTQNKLPNVYSAFMYFKKTDKVKEFFELSRDIFQNWEAFSLDLLDAAHRPTTATTDVVYGMVAKILDVPSWNKMPSVELPVFTHMKTMLQNWPNVDYLAEDWTQNIHVYFTPQCECKIGAYKQRLPLHYYVKEFLTDDMIKYLEKKVQNG